MKIGVIGYGNMGSMIVNNILKMNLLLEDEELIVSNRHIEKISHLVEEYEDARLQITDDNTKIAKECEKIIIAVETPQFKDLIEEIIPFLNENSHIIYTCAGLEFNHIKTFYDGKLSLVIPTLASTVTNNNSIGSISRRKGVSLIKHNNKVELKDSYFLEDLFNEFSYVRNIDDHSLFIEENEKYRSIDFPELEISTIITSCGPAYIALMIERFAKIASASRKIQKSEAEDMIVKTLLGTAILKEDHKLTNQEIIDMVATKEGITAEGLEILDKHATKGFKKLFDTLLKRYDEVDQEMNEIYLEK